MKLAAVLLLVAGMQSPPPARPVPVAANTVAGNPDSYIGQTVSVTAPVDRSLTRSAFVIDQDAAKSAALELLVIAPTLTAAVPPHTHVTIVGEVLRFHPDEIAQRAKGYRLDLTPEMIEKHRGRPAILATSVVTAAMVDLAKPPPRPLTPEEEGFDKVMKRVGPAFSELRTAATASNAQGVAGHARELKAAFAEAEAFWKARKTADAIEWTRTARTHLTTLERAAAAGRWDQVKTSVADVNRACSTCHTAYRERLEDGTYRVKTR